jgi:hypothetical protein
MEEWQNMNETNVNRRWNRIGMTLVVLAAGTLPAAPVQADIVLLTNPPDPGVRIVVNTVTGDVSMVGQPGAEIAQYAVSSVSGSLVFSPFQSVSTHSDENLSGLENYVLWMDMSDPSAQPPHIWDKCCPLADPTADGRIYFDQLANRTLDLGDIYNVKGPEDLVFSYSYGYVTGQTAGGSGQLIGDQTYPAPGVHGDGVSAYGQVSYGPPWYVPGDVNHDGVLNAADIDAIYQHLTAAPPGYVNWPRPLGGYQSQYDVNGDGAVTQADVTYELNHYFLTSYGDANLDKTTDFADFQALLDHWQTSGAGVGWAQADFNGDGVVDFLDFQSLLDYWNPSGWNFAPAQVPEPASLTVVLLGGLDLLRRSRKA